MVDSSTPSSAPGAADPATVERTAIQRILDQARRIANMQDDAPGWQSPGPLGQRWGVGPAYDYLWSALEDLIADPSEAVAPEERPTGPPARNPTVTAAGAESCGRQPTRKRTDPTDAQTANIGL